MNEAILEQVKQKIEEVFPAVVAFRRDLHEHPELSGHEERTSRRIAEELVESVKNENVEAYRMAMDALFGENSCQVMSIRKYGGISVI